ncbi:hypothetical protein [Candidatus Leptofilum sp.]|uniref:hypothetical protein n=1 Tax=Candidatus Leptofilum sp. TaxID=3241576 RepID=UPI003B5C76B3
MQSNQYMRTQTIGTRLSSLTSSLPKKTAVGGILIIALIAFEIFNFDTTKYALNNLIGDVRFWGMQWAAILAIAFCAIDFAGLVRLFTPERGMDEPKEVWYLMGAWLLGATMNAVMTWWAISLTLLNHNLGNEVLTREQLLLYVPIFVAVLVWLTRILFIGAFSVAGEHIFEFNEAADTPRKRPAAAKPRRRANTSTVRRTPVPKTAAPTRTAVPKRASVQPTQVNMPIDDYSEPQPQPTVQRKPVASRVRQRPPRPNGMRRSPMTGLQARPRNRN